MERTASPVFPLLLLAASGCAGGEAATARPRNLLLVCIDTLRADHLGAYGADPSPSPAIDALAAASVQFDDAHSSAPWTLPSIATVFTSHSSSAHGCWTFSSRLGEGFTTLPEAFQAAGFDTYGIASHVFFDPIYGLQQGFDGFDDELARVRGQEGWQPVTSPLVTEKAVRWLEGRAQDADPFLLFVHYFDPHLPYVDHERPEGEPGKRDEHERYRSEIAFTDRSVSELLQALERLGLAPDTAVVLFADHGEAFGEHYGVVRHGTTFFEEEIHVPLLIRVPGLAPRRVASFVGTISLLPTLRELFALPDGGEDFEGRSLVALLHGEELEPRSLLLELRLHDTWQLRGIYDGRWKLVEEVSRRRLHIFDLERDPGERQDLAEARPETVQAMLAEVERRTAQGASLGAARQATSVLDLDPEVIERLRALGYVDPGETGGAPR